MNVASNFTATRTATTMIRSRGDRSDEAKPVARFGETIRRLLNALMRSLATPHI